MIFVSGFFILALASPIESNKGDGHSNQKLLFDVSLKLFISKFTSLLCFLLFSKLLVGSLIQGLFR